MLRAAFHCRVISALCFAALGASSAVAEDWPRWRGPRGDGTWNGPKIATTWPKDGLKTTWKVPIGGGYAGVTVEGGRVYLCDRQTKPREVERVLCFDVKTGRRLWAHEYAAHYGKLDYGNGPRAAAVVHNGRVYSVGALGHVFCLDAKNGKPVWSLHLQNDFKGRLPMWGYAASPLIVDGTVILQPGAKAAGVIAVKAATGKVAWKSLADDAGYATPVLFTHNNRRQLLCWTPSHIRSLHPQTGKLFWSVPYKITYKVAIATPVVHRGIAFVSGYWEGSKAIQLGKKPADGKLLWEENRYLRGLMSQPLCRDGYVYLLDKRYGLTCFELRSGKKLWDDKNKLTPRGRNPQASLVWTGNGSRILALNSDGQLVLAEISPKGYRELARSKIIGRTWAHPAYAGNRVFARSDSELVCVELPVNPR